MNPQLPINMKYLAGAIILASYAPVNHTIRPVLWFKHSIKLMHIIV